MPAISAGRPADQKINLPQGIGLRSENRAVRGYRERIRLLQENPSIANSPFNHTYTFTPSVGWFKDSQPPKTVTEKENANCFGATAWVFGIEKQVEEVWRKAIKAKRSYEANGNGAYITFAETDRPGYIGNEPMRAFLRFSPIVELVKEAMEGDIITQWYSDHNEENCGFEIKHSAIILPHGLVFEKEAYWYDIRSDRSVSNIIADVPSTANRVHNWIFRIHGAI